MYISRALSRALLVIVIVAAIAEGNPANSNDLFVIWFVVKWIAAALYVVMPTQKKE